MTIHLSVLPTPVLECLTQQLSANDTPSPTRFFRLPHPRTGVSSLYLPHVRTSSEGEQTLEVLEVQSVSPPNARSWFLEDDVVGDGKLLIMTPVDPALMLVPIVYPAYLAQTAKGKPRYLPLDDFIEDSISEAVEYYKKLVDAQDPSTAIVKDDISKFMSLPTIHSTLRRICEVKEPTPEITAFCFSPTKFNDYLRTKISRLATQEVFEGCKTLLRNLAKDGLLEDGKEKLLSAGRIKGACELVSHYLNPSLRDALFASYANELKELDVYIKTLELEAAERMAAEEATTKKGKKVAKAKSTDSVTGTSEKKRKATKESKGVETLKKVNVDGVRKISSFFAKT